MADGTEKRTMTEEYVKRLLRLKTIDSGNGSTDVLFHKGCTTH